ncbi:IS630 family transposase [Photorhabdus stackebrandtii]|nr:IS630 family transposase [Photorhabdus stackebrandtii]
MKIFITDEQKAELEHLHHTCRDKRECDRIKAVLLASEGWSSVMIAQALRLHETTVNRHISDYHPTQGTKLAYGWMRKGQKTAVKTTGSRTRLNLMGALNLADIGKTVVREYDRIDSYHIAEFFIALRETYPVSQKVHIILDGAGYHRSELVKDWAYVMNIELHYLPPYSPNLNPIERLWKVMNEQVRNNRYFASAALFRQAIHRFFTEILPELAGKLSRRINDNFQILNPASSS